MMDFRVDPKLRGRIVRWAEMQPDNPSLSEAARRLVEVGLTVEPGSRQQHPARSQKAREMAGRQLDQLVDKGATSEEQASRKRRLLGGPEEFQSIRIDRPDKARPKAR